MRPPAFRKRVRLSHATRSSSVTSPNDQMSSVETIRVARAINANAEDLHEHVAAGTFDFAYCCNALDHVEEQLFAVEGTVTGR